MSGGVVRRRSEITASPAIPSVLEPKAGRESTAGVLDLSATRRIPRASLPVATRCPSCELFRFCLVEPGQKVVCVRTNRAIKSNPTRSNPEESIVRQQDVLKRSLVGPWRCRTPTNRQHNCKARQINQIARLEHTDRLHADALPSPQRSRFPLWSSTIMRTLGSPPGPRGRVTSGRASWWPLQWSDSSLGPGFSSGPHSLWLVPLSNPVAACRS